MAVIVVMLVTAIIPTGNFAWPLGQPDVEADDLKPSPGSYAICFYGKPVSKNKQAYPSMIISTCLLIFGFLARVVRLHKTLSIDLVLYLRSKLSCFARKCLRKIYAWSNVHTNAPSLIRLLLYRPLLTVFLGCRVFLDMWSSMFLEVRLGVSVYDSLAYISSAAFRAYDSQVWWLLVAFIWGAIRLGYTLRLYGIDTSRGAWTFGQVISLVLLAAPLISILEFWNEGEHRTAESPKASPETIELVQVHASAEQHTGGPPATEPDAGTTLTPEPPTELTQSRIPTLEIAERLSNAPFHGFRDEPDLAFYKEATWFHHIILFFLWMAFSLGMTVLLWTAQGDDLFWGLLYPTGFESWDWTPLVICWLLMCFTLFIITIEDIGSHFQASTIRSGLLALMRAAIYFGCSVTYLGIGIGITPFYFGYAFDDSALWPSMANPCVALVLTLLVMVGSGAKAGQGRSITKAVVVYGFYTICSGMVYGTCSVCGGKFLEAVGERFFSHLAWLYLVVPPGLYMMISLIYWILLRIRTFMPTFRRNQ
ncbi:hypothetical protein H2200_013367 [Cladophialophora chaetospira]|uniref:Uncharacterized protein n=1 Tax=Cladophialophora chaetospira TaxID=386627 RepID=A0AA38WW70_9EURO|nr:hypothetical protein H2200_013367 [Cladophialophora chaetospira]